MSKIIKTSEFTNLVEVKKGIVVVDFFATWCGPCKMLSPVYNSLKDEMSEKADFYKVDIDESMELAERFVVTTVPTVVIFEDGKEMERLVGFIPKNNLKDKIESYL